MAKAKSPIAITPDRVINRAMVGRFDIAHVMRGEDHIVRIYDVNKEKNSAVLALDFHTGQNDAQAGTLFYMLKEGTQESVRERIVELNALKARVNPKKKGFFGRLFRRK
ncbi:MAG: hypothetical protein NUV67_04105 [archaeon]|nr:hypothetical protein [archaeon]